MFRLSVRASDKRNMKIERSKQKEDGVYGNTILLNLILVTENGRSFTETG